MVGTLYNGLTTWASGTQLLSTDILSFPLLEVSSCPKQIPGVPRPTASRSRCLSRYSSREWINSAFKVNLDTSESSTSHCKIMSVLFVSLIVSCSARKHTGYGSESVGRWFRLGGSGSMDCSLVCTLSRESQSSPTISRSFAGSLSCDAASAS